MRTLLLPLLFGCMLTGCAPGDDHPAKDREPIKEDLKQLPSPRVLEPRIAVPDSDHGKRVLEAIRNVRQRDLLVSNSFWTIFHGILGVGPDVTLLSETGQRLNAINYFSRGGEIRGLQFIPTKNGLDVKTGPPWVGQGHQDQFIAEMAEWGMKPDHPFIVNGKDYTFEDFIRHSQMHATTQDFQELSWAIIMISEFRGTDATWTNERGEKLKFDDIVRYELDQPVDSAACGGTHRLFGLSWAYHRHMERGGKRTPIWDEVVAKTRANIDRARKYQNSDGSFSSKYLAGPGLGKEAQPRIGTTGHVLEWLTLALSDKEIREPWVQNAAEALALMILENADQLIESGALYHATHGLQMYYARIFCPVPGAPLTVIPPHPDDLKKVTSSK